MNQSIKIFDTPQLAAEALAEQFKSNVERLLINHNIFTIALAGGNTPRLFYTILGNQLSDWPVWNKVHLFWGDERCVPPSHMESNYRMVKESLIDKINIPDKNIHRIHGESEPASETLRYQQEIIDNISESDSGWPVFNWILLGMGDDGHTASIFPGADPPSENQPICTAAVHPLTRQKRVSLTIPAINRAKEAIFLISGRSKAPIVRSIINREKDSVRFPAVQVIPLSGNLTWYLDLEAGNLL